MFPKDVLNRRQFIGSTGTLAMASMLGARRAFASFGKIGDPVSDTDAATGGTVKIPGPAGKRVNYAVVGLGKFALSCIIPGFANTQHSRLTALVSGDPDKARAIAAAYDVDPRNIYNYENFDRIVDNPDIDAVFIILPNGLHAEYTVRAAAAGKHVLCEKPMATSAADCRRMIEACKNADRKLMIAYRCHYEPYNKTMMAWGQQQKFGPIHFVDSSTVMDVGGANQWRLDPVLSGGGSLVDIGIYSLNAVRYLTGEEPIAINAFRRRDTSDARFSRIEQSIAFQLQFPSGAIANCASSYGTALLSRYRVMARDGWYGLEPATLYNGLRMFHGSGHEVHSPYLVEVNQFAAETDHFSECVLHDRQPDTGGDEGLRDVELIEKIYAAAN